MTRKRNRVPQRPALFMARGGRNRCARRHSKLHVGRSKCVKPATAEARTVVWASAPQMTKYVVLKW
jgi:hypothetical protein